jgi:hypothetical protein
MRLLRTAAAGFVNAEKIIRLGEGADGWVAILEGGEEVALGPLLQRTGARRTRAARPCRGIPRHARRPVEERRLRF